MRNGFESHLPRSPSFPEAHDNAFSQNTPRAQKRAQERPLLCRVARPRLSIIPVRKRLPVNPQSQGILALSFQAFATRCKAESTPTCDVLADRVLLCLATRSGRGCECQRRVALAKPFTFTTPATHYSPGQDGRCTSRLNPPNDVAVSARARACEGQGCQTLKDVRLRVRNRSCCTAGSLLRLVVRTSVKTAPDGLVHSSVSPMPGDQPGHVDGAQTGFQVHVGRV